MTTALLFVLAGLAAPPPDSASPDPYAGLYGCNINGNQHHLVWIGTVGEGMRANDQWTTYELLSENDFPFDEEIRAKYGSSYHTRDGGFNSGNSQVYFEDGDLWLQDEPCEKIGTVRDALTLFDLDPAEVAQEVMDLEGWSTDQTAARLDDGAFANSAFAPTANFRRGYNMTFAKVVLGRTLPEPPPPPNAAPEGARLPEGSDAFAGIYVDGGSSPRIHLVRDGRYVQFERESNRKRYGGGYGFAYLLEDAYDYTVRGGDFTYRYTDIEFTREGNRSVELIYRGQDARRVYTLRQLIAENDFDLDIFTEYLRDEYGLADGEIDARLDDAVAFDRAVQEGDETITFDELAGISD